MYVCGVYYYQFPFRFLSIQRFWEELYCGGTKTCASLQPFRELVLASAGWMFKHEKLFLGTDVVDRDALSKRLTENGATIVATVGEQDSIHVFNSFQGVSIVYTSSSSYYTFCLLSYHISHSHTRKIFHFYIFFHTNSYFSFAHSTQQ
jgi:hypothetical protein